MILRLGHSQSATSSVTSSGRAAGRQADACSSDGTRATARLHLPACSAHHSSASSLSAAMSVKSRPARKLPFTKRISRSTLPLVKGWRGLQSLVRKPTHPMKAA